MKHPNGYGSVVKLSGNRRKPYVVRKTVGWNDKGHPKYDIIGYYSTRQEGLQALAMYNNKPYDVDVARMTLSEVFKLWDTRSRDNMNINTYQNYKYSFTHFASLHDVRFVDIKVCHLIEIFSGVSPGTQLMMKALYSNLEDLALSMDIISKKNSNLIKLKSPQAKPRRPFDYDEIACMWKLQGTNMYIDIILILLYTGMRINELLDLKLSDYKDNFLTGGSKTAAGKNRLIPVHPKIKPILDEFVSKSTGEYLINYNGTQVNYWNLRHTGTKLNIIKHTFHECRHTLRSELDRQNANRVCIDLILGHASPSVGERVYTHKTREELMETILLISY